MAGALTPENGWHLTPEGLQLCGGQLQKALNFDLREIGSGILSEEINRGKQESLSPGLVLQVSKIRNVSAPKINEESGGAPRMLKISLTDGQTTVHAVEMSKLDGISLNTAPGTKVKFLKEVPVSNGFLQLETGSLKVLGGRVEALAAKWEIANEMASVSRNRRGPNADSAEDGPPAWVPFGQKIGSSGDKDFKAFSANQTAGATNNNSNSNQASKDNATFDSQRQDAILQASKSGGQKVFGAGSKDIKEAENPKKRRGDRGGGDKTDDKSTIEASAATTTTPLTTTSASTSEFAVNGGVGGGGRGENRRGGGRRGGRNQRDAEDKAAGQTKPSTNVSLFDFLEEKLPADAANSDGGKKSALAAERGGSHGGSGTDQRYSSGRRNQAGGDEQNFDRPRDGGDRRRRGGGGPVPDSRERENGSAGEGRTRGGGDKRGGGSRNERGGGHEQRRGGGTHGGGDRSERGGDRAERGGDRPDRGGRGGGRGGRRDGGRENREDFKTEEQPRRGGDRDKPDRESSGRGRGGGRGGGENGGRGGGRESHRNEPRGGDFNQGRQPQQQHESGGHTRGGGKPHNNDRDFGEWSNSTYHNAQRTRGGGHQHQQPPRRDQHQQQQQQHQQHSSLINKMSELHVDDSLQHQQHISSRDGHPSQQFVQVVKPLPQQQQQQQDFSQPPPTSGHQSSQWGSIGSSKGFTDQGGKQFWNQPAPPQQQQQQQQHSSSNAASKIRWQKGDDALGLYWEDSMFYPVKITALTESTAVVLFKEYGNYEEVFLKDLLPLPSASGVGGGNSSLHQQPRGPAGFIPSTPGLPPAFPH